MAAFIRAGVRTVGVGRKKTHPIFLFVLRLVVFTVGPKLWERRFWMVRRVVLFGA